jgi:hypothetical protein
MENIGKLSSAEGTPTNLKMCEQLPQSSWALKPLADDGDGGDKDQNGVCSHLNFYRYGKPHARARKSCPLS